MNRNDLNALRFLHPEIVAFVQKHQNDDAMKLARLQLARALSDLSAVEHVCGKSETGLQHLQQAINASAECDVALHNLVAALLSRRMLKGKNLETIQKFIADHIDTVSWVRNYSFLLLAPQFLNVEFVGGKCNLNCRMCVGTNSSRYTGELRSIDVSLLDRMMHGAETICGITLSSGDSDPLLHPQISEVIELGKKHQVPIDMFTNGHALSTQLCRQIVESKAFGAFNVSIDAATPETYVKVRRASFDHVIRRIEMLQAMKAEMKVSNPWVSLSFVAMADTIQELPEFVLLADRLGASRVYVEDLNGWENASSENRPAYENPNWHDYVQRAIDLASEKKIHLRLTEGLTHGPKSTDEESQRKPTVPIRCCNWISGVWVQMSGVYHPCCILGRVVDMGCVDEGSLLENPKFLKVKTLLAQGKVFPQCLGKRQCEYIQNMKMRGLKPAIITQDELGDQYIAPSDVM
jgi:MoaA/NifB/PqqE/SkfB family radical SAM enzyme